MDPELKNKVEEIRRMGEKGAMPPLPEETEQKVYMCITSNNKTLLPSEWLADSHTHVFLSAEDAFGYACATNMNYCVLYAATLPEGWSCQKRSDSNKIFKPIREDGDNEPGLYFKMVPTMTLTKDQVRRFFGQ